MRLQRRQTYGSTRNVLIGRIRDVAVDSSGRVYIADQKQWNIKVFAPNGRFIKTLGRSGKGPGEFVDIIFLQIKNNELFAHDNQLARAVVFSLDSLSFTRVVKIAQNKNSIKQISDSHLDRYWVRDNSGYLVRFIKAGPIKKHHHAGGKFLFTGYYYFLNRQGQISSQQLFTMPYKYSVFLPMGGGLVGRPVKLYGQSLVALDNRDYIYAAWSSHFLIKIYSPKGAYQRAIYYPYHNATLPSSSLYPHFGKKSVQRMDLPQTWPTLHDIKMDDQNRLWISTIVKDQKVYQWWVLNDQGKLLARFRWPRDKEIETIKGGHLYTRETDAKGVPQIVRYKIQLQPNKN